MMRAMAKLPLRLPLVLASVVVGTIAAMACESEEEGPGFYCFDTRTDAGPGQPDASPCPTHVEHYEDCPPGCEPLG